MFLFKVEHIFSAGSKGLVLYPGIEDKRISSGAKIKLIRPDHSIIETTIKGIVFEGTHDILIDGSLRKKDIPVGTEVWLIE